MRAMHAMGGELYLVLFVPNQHHQIGVSTVSNSYGLDR